MFTQEQLDVACELQKTDDRPIGKVLISLSYLTCEDLALALGGIVAGWGKLELHERGFKCGVAKILAVFAPHPRRTHPHYGELTWRTGLLWRGYAPVQTSPCSRLMP
jgi:hypothetical protein